MRQNYYSVLYQTFLRLRESARFAELHPLISFKEFAAIQEKIWLYIASENGPVSIIQMR